MPCRRPAHKLCRVARIPREGESVPPGTPEDGSPDEWTDAAVLPMLDRDGRLWPAYQGERTTMDFAFAAKVFAALFAIMNPIANLPIFLSLTSDMGEAEQRRAAILVTVTVTVGCFVSALAGSAILGFFGLDVDHFRLAGGLIVLLIALSMLHGEDSATHGGSGAEKATFNSASNVAFYPLAIPILLGPGTISALIVYAHDAHDRDEQVALGAGIVVFVILLGATLVSGPFIGRIVSPTVMSVTKRLMGMVLAAIAMEMLVASLRALFPGLT